MIRLPSCMTAAATILVASAGCAKRVSDADPRPAAGPDAAQQWIMSAVVRGMPEELDGNVIIRSAPNGPDYEILLDVRQGPGTPDGTADRMWGLQRTEGRRIRPIYIEGARVYSRRGELLVIPPGERHAYQFVLGAPAQNQSTHRPADEEERRARFLNGSSIIQQWVGVGIYQYIGRWPHSPDAVLPSRVVARE